MPSWRLGWQHQNLSVHGRQVHGANQVEQPFLMKNDAISSFLSRFPIVSGLEVMQPVTAPAKTNAETIELSFI